ncbi:MAG: hypothetical protein IPN76_20070 [Saprospiraceae bacterium]|nr:hypothetical protein [Saprospiraceae bacterium]
MIFSIKRILGGKLPKRSAKVRKVRWKWKRNWQEWRLRRPVHGVYAAIALKGYDRTA